MQGGAPAAAAPSAWPTGFAAAPNGSDYVELLRNVSRWAPLSAGPLPGEADGDLKNFKNKYF